MHRFNPAEIPASPDLRFEIELWNNGYSSVAGIDEAGRGCWAGPVSAAAVIFSPRLDLLTLLPDVRDSKKISPAKRLFCELEIKKLATFWAVGFATNQEIDQLGIVPATHLAMTRAIQALNTHVDHLLIDAVHLPSQSIPQTSLIKGDARVFSIAAASILAKTARDTLLRELDSQYPGYGFAHHKGYGTAQHQEALKKIGPCAIHRYSFAPVQRAELPTCNID